MHIGVNPLSWSNDDLPSLGGETSLEQCLREGREAGYEGFELGTKFPRDPEQLSAVLAAHDLRLVSGWFSGSVFTTTAQQEIERLKPHCDLLSKCGSEVIIYCDTTSSVQSKPDVPLATRRVLTEAQWPSFCDKLSEVARWSNEQKMPLAYHYHMGTLIQTEQEIDRLMKSCSDELGLLVDTGHASFAGIEPLDLVKRYINRIRHVHLKDVRREIMQSLLNRDASFIDSVLAGVFTVPGDGDLPMDAIISALVRGGYDSWLVVEAEQDPVIAPSLPMVTRAFHFVQTSLERASL